MSSKGKKSRRVLTLATSGVLLIALSACSGATNNHGKLSDKTEYASAGSYSISETELWDELKWSSKDVLISQINNVVLDSYITNIKTVLNKNYTDLTDAEKETLEVTGDKGSTKFDALKTKYEDRLVDYVIQDIYNFNYKVQDEKTYLESYEQMNDDDKEKLTVKYADEMYASYKVTKIGNDNLSDLVKIDNDADPYDHRATYLQIANEESLRQVYYVDFARELLAYAKKTEEVKEADEDDTDEDDDKWGNYTNANYISTFKSKYTYTYDVNAVLIKFTDSDELNNTLRAFGIKIYNSKLYYIYDKDDTQMTYQDYIEYYDDFSNSKLENNIYGAGAINDEGAILEIFVQIYNYMYSGYRTKLSTGNGNFDITNKDRNSLRKLTEEIIEAYLGNEDYYDKAKSYLVENFGQDSNKEDSTKVIYEAKELNKIANTLKTNIYEALKVDEKPYTTSGISVSGGQYLAFKLGDLLETTSKNKDYEKFYNVDNKATDLTDYEILSFIKNTEGLKDDLEAKLINDEITESNISTYVSNELKETKVKIYNEACEIAYSIVTSDYSRTIGGASNSNILAVIEYDNKSYNVNIKADDTDEKSMKIVGTDKAFGVYDYLENKSGETTSISLLTKKMIKDTEAYEKTNDDRADYEKYLQVVLLNFANDGYSSSGYASTIGKYNFLMMYFHSADVDTIIDNYYRVQYATGKILTNYASDDLTNFLLNYTNTAYDNYFSLGATRLVVYFDADDDSAADDRVEWYEHVLTADETDVAEFVGKSREYVAKSLIYELYSKVCSSTKAHADVLTSLVTEFNATAKIKYEENPIESENQWSKYRHLGFLLKTEDITVTNASLDVDFNIKSRLYDYARGHNDANTKTYQYFINETAPTCYIEELTADSVTNNDIVASKDGYNLLLVTSGTSAPSAKWEEKDDTVQLLNNIVIKYNEDYVKITDVYNNTDKLNKNQIKLYLLDYVVNNASTLSPTETSSAISSFLSPAVTRFTADETQSIILLSFIKKHTNQAETTELYDVIKFAQAGKNGADGTFATIISINQNIADDYQYLYKDKDITNTSDLYPDWWENIKQYVANFLLKEGE